MLDAVSRTMDVVRAVRLIRRTVPCRRPGAEFVEREHATAEFGQQSGRSGGVGRGGDDIRCYRGLDVQSADIVMSEGQLLDQHDLQWILRIAGLFQKLVAVRDERVALDAAQRPAEAAVQVCATRNVAQVGSMGFFDDAG